MKMKKGSDHIHPIFGQVMTRQDKESLLDQKGAVLWMTGLSGSGKSTIAQNIERVLHEQGYLVKLLDGDNIRSGINQDLGFSEEDRKENIRRIAEIAKLFVDTGIITIVSFISPTNAVRDAARAIIGAEDFFEVFVSCPLEVCEERDVKGLYKKARAGLIPDFTGISSPFEIPENPAIILPTHEMTIDEAVAMLERFVIFDIIETEDVQEI